MRYATLLLLIVMATAPSAFGVEPATSLAQFHEAVWAGDVDKAENEKQPFVLPFNKDIRGSSSSCLMLGPM